MLYVMVYKLKVGMFQQMADVLSRPREQVVQADDIMSLCNQTGTQMRTYKTSSPCYENFL